MITLLFFAQLSEALNVDRLDIDLQKISPFGEPTVFNIKQYLYSLDQKWCALDDASILSAVNHDLSRDDTLVTKGDEVAFFPPVTGG